MKHIWVILLSFYCLGHLQGKPVSENIFTKQAASWVNHSLPPTAETNISVLPISYADGTYSAVGYLLSSLIESELLSHTHFNVIEREQLHFIQQEIDLAKYGYTQSNLTQMGKVLATDFFIYGTFIDKGTYLQVNMRIADAKTGKVTSEKAFEVNYKLKSAANPIWSDIENIKKSGKQFKINVWTEQNSLNIGDSLTIKFRADRNCFVTIFSMGTSGKINILYPNRIQPHNFVNKGVTYSIPGPYDRFAIKASPPSGLNKIKAFATTKRIPLVLKSDKASFFREVTEQDAIRFRDLTVILDKTKGNRWAEANWEVLIKK